MNKKLFNGINHYPKGFSLSVPPAGNSGTLKIQKVRGKSAIVRAIYADNLTDVYMTISKEGSGPYIDNVALSVFRSDRPIPIEMPEGDYTVILTSRRLDTVTANIALLIQLGD
jgi:hypothetical protein